MPVVRVDDVGRPVREVGEDRAAEERIALGVVGVAVDLVATDAKAPDEHDARAVTRDLRVFDPRVRGTVGDGAHTARRGYAELRLIDGPVIRDVYADVVTKRGQRLRQRAGDIGEAADLGVGGDLGGRERDAHGAPRMLTACKEWTRRLSGCTVTETGALDRWYA